MTIISKAEAKTLLTKSDLERLMKLMEAQMLRADASTRPIPFIVIRGQKVSLFDVLDLLGTL
jgi:hypothetical protein